MYVYGFQLESTYSGSRVLILGGGDGALLKELVELPDPPSHVTMVEIDGEVMSACSKHMRSVCGEYLEQRRGENFAVIEGDAFEEIKKFERLGTKFDFIFGDLTDTPIDATRSDSNNGGGIVNANSNPDNVSWTFLGQILRQSLSVLEPRNGRYMTHCNGKSVTKALANFETMVTALGLDYARRESFVPSFMETWVFYELFFKN